jgi:hypothetical protein
MCGLFFFVVVGNTAGQQSRVKQVSKRKVEKFHLKVKKFVKQLYSTVLFP